MEHQIVDQFYHLKIKQSIFDSDHAPSSQLFKDLGLRSLLTCPSKKTVSISTVKLPSQLFFDPGWGSASSGTTFHSELKLERKRECSTISRS